MAEALKIPLATSVTDQQLSIELGGNPYILRVLWNERFGYWSLSISSADDVLLLMNVKMVKNFPLIARYRNELLPFGDFYLVQESGTAERPGYDDLGVSFNLYYYDPDAL